MAITTTGSIHPAAPSTIAGSALSRSTVRELVIALATLEDQLRAAPPSERRTVARELSTVVHELRRRRQEMRALARQRA